VQLVPLDLSFFRIVISEGRRLVMRKLAQSLSIAVAATFLTAPVALAADAAAALTALDPDKDGTIDLKEADAGALALFKKLDPDKDGTLDAKELEGRLTAAELKAADPDNDGTLDEKEYLAVVKQKFEAANPDNDGTIDLAELESPKGQELLKLIYE
jgi:Ca2+-binding EF-hand superfamily protein